MTQIDHVATGDCERVRPGVVAQPVNTLTSLALVGAGARMLRRASARRDRWWQTAGASVLLAGIGSVAYHGPGGRLGHVVHDTGVMAAAVSVSVALAATPIRDPSASTASVWVGAAAGLIHTTSRSGGPLCRPDSLLQGHAAWHVGLAAAVLLAERSRA